MANEIQKRVDGHTDGSYWLALDKEEIRKLRNSLSIGEWRSLRQFGPDGSFGVYGNIILFEAEPGILREVEFESSCELLASILE